MSDGLALAVARGQVYDLLAIVFRRPLDTDRLARLRTPEMLAAIAAAGGELGAEFAERDEATLLDELAIDFTQLFHGPEHRLSPYASAQLGQGEDLMGPAANAARQFMAEVGFEVEPASGELPDHISVELAFMAALARREATARDAGAFETVETALRLQRQFLSDHLGHWVERFARNVHERATTTFYASMAELLARFLHAECEVEAA